MIKEPPGVSAGASRQRLYRTPEGALQAFSRHHPRRRERPRFQIEAPPSDMKSREGTKGALPDSRQKSPASCSLERFLWEAAPRKEWNHGWTARGSGMAVNQRKRQRQLARKAAQASARAKAVRASVTWRAVATSGFHPSARTWPVHEALISDAIWSTRQGTVILSRKLGESVAVAVFYPQFRGYGACPQNPS